MQTQTSQLSRIRCETNGCFPVLRFFYVRLRTYAQYTSMNEFTCSEHSVPTYVYVGKKKRSTGKQPLVSHRMRES